MVIPMNFLGELLSTTKRKSWLNVLCLRSENYGEVKLSRIEWVATETTSLLNGVSSAATDDSLVGVGTEGRNINGRFVTAGKLRGVPSRLNEEALMDKTNRAKETGRMRIISECTRQCWTLL